MALESQTSLKLGPGIAAQSKDEGKIQAHASKAGLLGLQESRSKQGPVKGYWVEGHSRRVCHFGCRDDAILKVAGQYVPALGEYVVGVITARHAEGYRVDIGSSQYAALDALAFEGATKRSKPNLKVRLLLMSCNRSHEHGRSVLLYMAESHKPYPSLSPKWNASISLPKKLMAWASSLAVCCSSI